VVLELLGFNKYILGTNTIYFIDLAYFPALSLHVHNIIVCHMKLNFMYFFRQFIEQPLIYIIKSCFSFIKRC